MTTAPSALSFLRGQLRAFDEAGFDVQVASAPDSSGSLNEMCEQENATFHEFHMPRRPNPLLDIRAIIRAFRLMRNNHPDIVVAGTPKASFVHLIASRMTNVPHRVYLCHGLRYEGANTWPTRALLRLLERILSNLATDVVAVSNSVKTGLISIGVSEGHTTVLGQGSPNGVDTTRFIPDANQATRILPNVLFVGRLTRDKGLAELLMLGKMAKANNFILTLVGTPEPHSSSDREILTSLKALPNVALLGHRNETASLYQDADLLVLPTRREGLPTVVLEAGASGVPTLAYRVTGTKDCIIDGVTGKLVPLGEAQEFCDTAVELINDSRSLKKMGIDARNHVRTHYDRPLVHSYWLEYVGQILAHRGLKP